MSSERRGNVSHNLFRVREILESVEDPEAENEGAMIFLTARFAVVVVF